MKIDGKQIDGSLTNKDKLLGSAFTNTVNGIDQFVTRNFTLQSIKDFVSGSVATEAIALKTNGGIIREGINNELAIDLGASAITGQLANADLANSSITINSTAVSLGGSITLNTDNVAEGSSNQYFTNARSRSSISVTGGGASYNSSTGVITLPTQFTLATGNVTNASVSGQTLTLTRQSVSDITFTPTANDFTDADHTKLNGIEASADVTDTANVVAALTAGTNIAIAVNGTISATDTNTQLSTEQVQDIVGAMFTSNTETRIAATYEDGDGTIDLVVDDMTANTQNTTTLSFVDSSNDILLRNTTGGATSGTQDIKFVAGSNVTLAHTDANNITISSQAFGTVFTVNSEANMISATSTGGDIVIRTDVSKTFIHNGGSAGSAADFSELQFSGINNLALTAGDGVDLSRTTVTNTNNDLTITNSLATTTERGGVKIGYTTDASARNYAIQLDSEKAYVNVPWTDTDTNTFRTVQADGSAIGATETLNLIGGTNVTLSESNGAITIAATDTDTNTFRTVTAGGNTLGSSETLAFTAGGNVSITENAGAVTIASTDTNTQRSDEDIRDVVVSMLTAGNNVALSEDDAANTLTITSTDTDNNTFRTVTVDTDGNGTADNTLGGSETLMIKKGTNITLTESSGVVTISSANTQLSQENVEDFVGGMLDGTETFITVGYDDTNGNLDFVVPVKDEDNMASNAADHLATQQSIKAYVDNSVIPALTTEQVQDIVGGMLGGTETGITVTYQDSTNDIDFVVDTQTDNNFTTALKNKLDGIEASADVTDTTNVTSAGALMDSEVTNLSQVKGFDSSDYATAAQGTKADSAQQPPSEGAFANGDKTKLDGIEASATADQTAAEIRTLVESASDSNVFTDADHTKLNGIEASATADQSNAEIRAAVEAASDSNVFTDADHTKLNAIESSATADQTASEIRTLVESASDSNVFTDADHTKLNGIETSATADQTITAGNGLSGGGTGNVTLTNSLFSDGKFFTVSANAAGGTLSLAQGLAASWNDSGGNGEVDIFFRDGGTNHGTNTLYFNSYNGTDTKQVIKLGGASAATSTYLSVSGRLLLLKDKLEIAGTAVTTTAAELNKLDGLTASTSELNVLDGPTAGTVSASKAVVVDSNKDITGFRNVTLTGTLDATSITTDGLTNEGDITISNAVPILTLNDSTSSSTSTSYTPTILFNADDVTKATIGKLSGSTNYFTAAKNHDGPVNIITSDIHSGHTHNPEYVFGYEPTNNVYTWGLQLKGNSSTSNSLYVDPDANNNSSSIYFGGYTNALNVSRISHNQGLGTVLFDVPDTGTSSLSVKFRQYNIGGYMQNMIDFEDDGDIKNINGSYGTIISDRRAKENIVDATPKLDDILSLEVKNFNLIGSNQKHIGLIAQDVENVFPSWVNTRDNRIYKTHDENGVLLEEQGELVSGFEDGKSLKVGMEFAVLVKTIQELNAKIVALEARVQTLENN